MTFLQNHLVEQFYVRNFVLQVCLKLENSFVCLVMHGFLEGRGGIKDTISENFLRLKREKGHA